MARTSTATIRGPHLSIAVVPAPLTVAATVVRAIFVEDISAGCAVCDVEWQRCGHEHSTSVVLVAVAATAIALVSSLISADTSSTVGSSA